MLHLVVLLTISNWFAFRSNMYLDIFLVELIFSKHSCFEQDFLFVFYQDIYSDHRKILPREKRSKTHARSLSLKFGVKLRITLSVVCIVWESASECWKLKERARAREGTDRQTETETLREKGTESEKETERARACVRLFGIFQGLVFTPAKLTDILPFFLLSAFWKERNIKSIWLIAVFMRSREGWISWTRASLDALSRKRTSDRCSERDVPDKKKSKLLNWQTCQRHDIVQTYTHS